MRVFASNHELWAIFSQFHNHTKSLKRSLRNLRLLVINRNFNNNGTTRLLNHCLFVPQLLHMRMCVTTSIKIEYFLKSSLVYVVYGDSYDTLMCVNCNTLGPLILCIIFIHNAKTIYDFIFSFDFLWHSSTFLYKNTLRGKHVLQFHELVSNLILKSTSKNTIA